MIEIKCPKSKRCNLNGRNSFASNKTVSGCDKTSWQKSALKYLHGMCRFVALLSVHKIMNLRTMSEMAISPMLYNCQKISPRITYFGYHNGS